MKTIKQIADELGVSKQAVRKRVNQLPPTEIKKNARGTIELDEEVAGKIIAAIIANRQPVTSNLPETETEVASNLLPTVTSEVTSLINTLQEQLKVKDEQIASLNRSLDNVTAALHEAQTTANTAQALHAGTIQQQLKEPEEPKKGFFSRWFDKKHNF